MNTVFYIAAAVVVVSTAAVVLTSCPVRALRWLALSLLASAVLAYAVAAPLAVAVAAVLHLGALLLARRLSDPAAVAARERRWRVPRAWVVPGVLAAILLLELTYVLRLNAGTGAMGATASLRDLGAALAQPYGVAAGLVLLLAATVLIACLQLARRYPARDARDG